MAERRMFAKTIIDSDSFLDMPLSSQALYFHLSMRADDDGFLNNAQKVIRMVGASKNDYDLLLMKNFIISLEDGICVIKHWRIHNYIRADRYKPTLYQDEYNLLATKDNKSYSIKDDIPLVEKNQVDTIGIPSAYQCETQVRLGKDRLELGKDNIVEPDETKVSNGAKAPPIIFNEVIDYLNLKTGKKFKSSSKDTKKVIKARQLEGFNLEDFKKVIDNKVKDWINNSDFNKYLKPDTLFGKKFEGYLNQKSITKNSNNKKVAPGFNNFEPREYDYDSLEKKLLGWDNDEN